MEVGDGSCPVGNAPDVEWKLDCVFAFDRRIWSVQSFFGGSSGSTAIAGVSTGRINHRLHRDGVLYVFCCRPGDDIAVEKRAEEGCCARGSKGKACTGEKAESVYTGDYAADGKERAEKERKILI